MHALHPLGPRHEGSLSTPAVAAGETRPSSSGLHVFTRLLRYARPYLGVIAVALAIALLYAGAVAARSYLLKPLFDDVLLRHPDVVSVPGFGGDAEAPGSGAPPAPGSGAPPAPVADEQAALAELEARFWEIVLAGVLVASILPLSAFGKDYLSEYAMGLVRVDLQQVVCAKLLALPLRFHQSTTRGDTLSRAMNDVGRAYLLLNLLFGDVVQAALRVLASGAMLFVISWQLTLVSLLMAPVLVGVVGVFGRRIRKTARRRQEKIGDVTHRLVEILSGIKVIQSFRGEQREADAFARENRKLFQREMKVVKNRVLSRSLVEMVSNGVAVAMLLLGALILTRQEWDLSTGELIAFCGVMATLHKPTKSVTKGWNKIMDALPACDRFFALLDAETGPDDAPDAVDIDGVREGIRISKISFAYGREPVLRDFSLEVDAGEVVAIVGRTGAGKSTLADLLLRFYDPQSGSIEIDGVDVRRIRRRSLLRHIAIVGQEPFLFAGTVRENILYGRPHASPREFQAVVRAAHVDEFAEILPSGYDTPVGELGGRLSGGQRQRITIARAILKDPAILIFDEATSSLDAKSERLVQDAVEAMFGGRTVFVIAHRLSTIRRADRIVVLEAGGGARVGRHDALMAEAGLYRELVSLQSEPV